MVMVVSLTMAVRVSGVCVCLSLLMARLSPMGMRFVSVKICKRICVKGHKSHTYIYRYIHVYIYIYIYIYIYVYIYIYI